MTTLLIHPLLADGALQFAIEKATPEGKATIVVLLILSLFSWTIIITKLRQLLIARAAAKKFFAAYSSTRDPLDIQRKGEEFDGAPAFEIYIRAADELSYHLKNNPVEFKGVVLAQGVGDGNTDFVAKANTTKISTKGRNCTIAFEPSNRPPTPWA